MMDAKRAVQMRSSLLPRAKYFDQDGKRISEIRYMELISGEFDNTSRESTIDDRIRVTIDLQGAFDRRIPDEYCNFLEVNIWNKVGEKWIKEPMQNDRKHNNMRKAVNNWLDIVSALCEQLGVDPSDVKDEMKLGAAGEEDDLEDYGEPELPKDAPKTKSEKSGVW